MKFDELARFIKTCIGNSSKNKTNDSAADIENYNKIIDKMSHRPDKYACVFEAARWATQIRKKYDVDFNVRCFRNNQDNCYVVTLKAGNIIENFKFEDYDNKDMFQESEER